MPFERSHMARPRIAVFSGPNATISNSPALVTSNKGRLPGEPMLEGRFDHLAGQLLHEPVTIRIRKFSAHPLEEDARELYHDDGRDYYEVELRPEDGPYLLPYMARRKGGPSGVPFEAGDLSDAGMNYGGRQFFYPDASRIFADIDRTISGRDERGEANILDRKADFDFIRALPSGGFTSKGEVGGVDYFPYRPPALARRPRHKDLARITNEVNGTLSDGDYAGMIWLQGSPTVEETAYWLGLLLDTHLPVACCASQRPHGQLANDGDRNIVDAVEFIVSGLGEGLGAVGVQDQQVFAAREFKKGDARPGGYKTTGGHGGVLGTIGPPITIWYKPAYRHTSASQVNLSRLPDSVEFQDRAGDGALVRVAIKDEAGRLRGEAIPRVHLVKFGFLMEEDKTHNPDHEVDIMVRIEHSLAQQASPDPESPKLHGFIYEGQSPFGTGAGGQGAALEIATFSGMPVVAVGRSDPGGTVPLGRSTWMIAGSNLDSTKARMLLTASMMKLGRLPKAGDPRNPTKDEKDAVAAKIVQYQEIFSSH